MRKYLVLTIILVFVSALPADEEISVPQKAFQLRLGGEKLKAESMLLQEINKKTDNPDVYFELARNYLTRTGQAKKYAGKAKSYIKKTIKMDRENARYYYWAGVIEVHDAIGAKQDIFSLAFAPFGLMAAKDRFEDTIEHDPNHLHARLIVTGLYQRLPWFLGGDKKKAQNQAEFLMEKSRLYGCRAYGDIYLDEKKHKTVIDMWKQAIRENPENAKMKEGLAYAYIEIGGEENLDKAFEQLKKTIKILPRTAVMLLELGRACQEEKLDNKAEQVYMRFTEVNKDTPAMLSSFTYLQLSKIEDKKGNIQKSRQYRKKAVELDPITAESDWLPHVVFFYDLFKKP